MTDDELEARLHDALGARDPGTAAPRELRDRIARVPTSATPARSLVARSTHGAGVVFATAAAVVVGIVAINALRIATNPVSGPGGAPSPSPSNGASAAVGAITAPVALDWGSIAGLLVLLLGVTLFVLETVTAKAWMKPGVPAPEFTFKRGFRWLNRARLRRLVFGIAFLATVVYPFAAGYVSHIEPGSTTGGYSSQALLGRRAGYDQQKDALFFWGGPGATITVEFSIRNGGSVPITVLGLALDPPYLADQIELRRFAVEEAGFYPAVDGTATVPFTPLELQPQDERGLLFVYHVGPCQGAYSPGSTPQPSGPPDIQNYLPPTTNFGSAQRTFTQASIRSSELGLDRTTWIDLGQEVTVVSPPGCQ